MAETFSPEKINGKLSSCFIKSDVDYEDDLSEIKFQLKDTPYVNYSVLLSHFNWKLSLRLLSDKL